MHHMLQCGPQGERVFQEPTFSLFILLSRVFQDAKLVLRCRAASRNFVDARSSSRGHGLLPLVRKMIFDFFGNFVGFETRSFPIRIRADSESAKQLLEALRRAHKEQTH